MSPLPTVARRNAANPAALVLGTMNFGKRTQEAESLSILDRAYERGLRHFDTANAYVDGESERILGRWLRSRSRDDVTVATKVGWWSRDGKPEGLSGERIVEACSESLDRLGLDVIDLYYLHVPDASIPVESTVEGLVRLVESKKIREIGFSNYASWQALELLVACDRAGLARPRVSQMLYNLLIRQLDLEYARFAARHEVAIVAYNALAGGLLTGKHFGAERPAKGSRFDKNRMYQGRYWSPRFFEEAAAYEGIARESGRSLIELSYAFLASSPIVDALLLGPATVAQLDQALDACARPLESDVGAAIDARHRAYLGTDASYAR